MQKKPLKVQPARRTYQPKYPSYEDKNPLLYPETRPYPFSQKFIKWASTGGLASIMLFSGSELMGQSQADSLYNPFPLKNAQVPYMPVSFGTGMPERIRSEEALQVIRKAFVESGVKLEENVWMDDNGISMYLDGYSDKDKIGFLFLDHSKMDASFIDKRSGYSKNKRQQKRAFNLNVDLERYEKTRKDEFLRFVKDKGKFIDQLTRYSVNKVREKFANHLSTLEPINESEASFNALYLQHDLDVSHEGAEHRSEFINGVTHYIDERFDDSTEKLLLLRNRNRLIKQKHYSDELYSVVVAEFEKLKAVNSDKAFIEKYLMLHQFLNYFSDQYSLRNDETYQALKLEIMQSHPLKKWFKNTDKLEAYKDKKFISLSEAKRLDKNNKKGTQFIAPISPRDNIMIVGDSRIVYSSEELIKEERALLEEYNQKNGMTKEIQAEKRAELQAISSQYTWSKMKKLPQAEKDSLRNQQREETAKIKAKYKAMEKLTDKEIAVFTSKFEDIRNRRKEQQKNHREELRMKTLQRLEKEVKVYIEWARSQMGG